jgi:TRAP-type C4-dicarboxylate transport system permease small subunit
MTRPGTPFTGGLTRLLDTLERWTGIFGSTLLSAMTLIILWQIVSRADPALNSPWTEEIARMLLVWFGMTGAATGVRRGSHIAIEFVVQRVPRGLQRFAAFLVSVLTLSFSLFLVVEGVALAKGCWTDAMSATLLPRGPFVYLAIPVASCLFVLYSLEGLLRLLAGEGGGAA